MRTTFFSYDLEVSWSYFRPRIICGMFIHAFLPKEKKWMVKQYQIWMSESSQIMGSWPGSGDENRFLRSSWLNAHRFLRIAHVWKFYDLEMKYFRCEAMQELNCFICKTKFWKRLELARKLILDLLWWIQLPWCTAYKFHKGNAHISFQFEHFLSISQETNMHSKAFKLEI